jgi:hypothetical protein
LRRRRGAARACVKAMWLIARTCVGNGRVQNNTFKPNNSCGSTGLCSTSGWATAGGASAVCTAVLCRCKVCSQTLYTKDGDQSVHVTSLSLLHRFWHQTWKERGVGMPLHAVRTRQTSRGRPSPRPSLTWIQMQPVGRGAGQYAPHTRSGQVT